MKNFIQYDIPKLKRVDSDSGRVYETPTGQRYPSVTSVTGIVNQQSISAWRSKVGEERATAVSTKASKRGTAVHSLCENYLLSGAACSSIADLEMFNSLVPHLNRIDNIHCLETQLFSHHLQVAGTVDCIAEYDGGLAVIDFKTASKPKREEWISHYFMQCAAYSFMFWERTKVSCSKMIVLVGVDDHQPQLFEQPVKPWLEKFVSIREQFRREKGI